MDVCSRVRMGLTLLDVAPAWSLTALIGARGRLIVSWLGHLPRAFFPMSVRHAILMLLVLAPVPGLAPLVAAEHGLMEEQLQQLLRRFPDADLNQDGKTIPSGASVYAESVSGDTLSATGRTLKTFAGNETMGSVSIEPFSVTTLIMP